jgi:hypothetical protein
LWIGTLHQVMNGTETNAPPAPTSADSKPMTPPAPNVPCGPGSWRDGLGLRFDQHLGRREADERREQPRQDLRRQRLRELCADQRAGDDAGRQEHHHVPAHGAAPVVRPHRDSDVKQIVASEVAIAILTT